MHLNLDGTVEFLKNPCMNGNGRDRKLKRKEKKKEGKNSRKEEGRGRTMGIAMHPQVSV